MFTGANKVYYKVPKMQVACKAVQTRMGRKGDDCLHPDVHVEHNTCGYFNKCVSCDKCLCIQCNSPVFKKLCPKGKKRPHLSHYAKTSICVNRGGISSLGESLSHKTAKEVLRLYIMENRVLRVRIMSCPDHYKDTILPLDGECKLETPDVGGGIFDVAVCGSDGLVVLGFEVCKTHATKKPRDAPWFEFHCADIAVLTDLRPDPDNVDYIECIRYKNNAPFCGRPPCEECKVLMHMREMETARCVAERKVAKDIGDAKLAEVEAARCVAERKAAKDIEDAKLAKAAEEEWNREKVAQSQAYYEREHRRLMERGNKRKTGPPTSTTQQSKKINVLYTCWDGTKVRCKADVLSAHRMQMSAEDTLMAGRRHEWSVLRYKEAQARVVVCSKKSILF